MDHSKGTVCSSGGIISDRPRTCHTLLVSLALIPLSPLCSKHLFSLCVCKSVSLLRCYRVFAYLRFLVKFYLTLYKTIMVIQEIHFIKMYVYSS